MFEWLRMRFAITYMENNPKLSSAGNLPVLEVKSFGKGWREGKVEKTAEKSGEVVGKGLKKVFGVAKEFGSGLKKGVKGEEKKKEEK